MQEIFNVISIKVLVHSIIIALMQNILVDVFKAGKASHFTQINPNVSDVRWFNRLLLISSGVIMFAVLYFTQLLTLKETVLTCFVSTIIAWILYKVKVYALIMDILITLKDAIKNLIIKKIGG